MTDLYWHSFLDAQLATDADRLFLTQTDGLRWRFGDLDRAVSDLCGLLTKNGVQKGDRVLLLAENCAAAIATLFACSRLGAPVIPVNARQSAAEVDRIADHAEPAVVLMTTGASPDARAHADRLAAIQVTGSWGQLHLHRRHSMPEDMQDTAVILYTTGTTGPPKGVMLTHANLRFGGLASADLRGMTPDDVIYGVLPITHVFGLASIVTAAVARGARIDLAPRFSAAALYQALRAGTTLLSAVPQMHALLMQYTAEQGFDRLESDALRYVSSGAAPLDPAWKRKAEAFYGVALQNGYGMTEATAGICATFNPLGSDDISVGPPLPGVELRLDTSVPGGGDGLGEVLVRGGNVMSGYFRNPAATEAVFDSEGWMRSGDLGRFDALGHLHITGRAKELIIHGGFNVFPPEVEAALNDHPDVVQSAVIGRMEAGDEKVVAFVQPVPGRGLTEDSLRAFVADRLAGYKRPTHLVIADTLPAAPTGKILKHRLLETFADRLPPCP